MDWRRKKGGRCGLEGGEPPPPICLFRPGDTGGRSGTTNEWWKLEEEETNSKDGPASHTRWLVGIVRRGLPHQRITPKKIIEAQEGLHLRVFIWNYVDHTVKLVLNCSNNFVVLVDYFPRFFIGALFLLH